MPFIEDVVRTTRELAQRLRVVLHLLRVGSTSVVRGLFVPKSIVFIVMKFLSQTLHI